MKRFTIAVIGVVIATASIAQTIPNWTKTSTPGSPGGAKTYTLHDLLSQGNAVLLDFMATWCGPCKSSTPSINSVWVDYGKGEGNFYAFALDVDNNETAAQLDAFGINYGGAYPAFIKCSSDYSFYNSNWGSGGIPLFILLKPNTGNPGASTVAWSQVGWGTGQEVSKIKAALATMGIFPSGISDIDGPGQGIFLYPNPATEDFSVYFRNIGNVDGDIFNGTGQLVESFNNLNNTLTVNTADYRGGIYFVRVSEEDGKVISTHKVNVEK